MVLQRNIKHNMMFLFRGCLLFSFLSHVTNARQSFLFSLWPPKSMIETTPSPSKKKTTTMRQQPNVSFFFFFVVHVCITIGAPNRTNYST